MSKIVNTLKEAGFADRMISDRQLARFAGGSDARRYGLVNRSLKDGSLLRIKRGLYTLAGQDAPGPHPFVIAQALLPGSYISFETALSFHDWIPETVHTTASVSPGRKTLVRQTDSFGHFSFHPLATERFGFLISVDRARFGSSVALVAQPLRALLDLVAQRKVSWAGLDWIEDGLRIDRSELTHLKRADFAALHGVYKHKKVREFLRALAHDVMQVKRTRDADEKTKP